MGDVFANGKEVSGKATPNKTPAALPDVCLSPPSPPAGPIPIPYPITGMASDSADGSGSVHIKKKETGKKNGSKYSKVNGNQPTTNSFGAGVVSHKITGALKFAAYSFDVMFEKGGAERFMDLTTQNHMNTPNSSVGMSVAGASVGPPDPECVVLDGVNQASRGSSKKGKSSKGTVAAAQYTPKSGGSSSYFRGRSTKSHVSAPLYRNGYNQGLWKDRNKRPKTAEGRIPSRLNDVPGCGERNYGNNAQGAINHAESKILEDLLEKIKTPGGTIKFKIDWPDHEPLPCPKCKKTLLAACECFVIELCDKNNQSYNWCDNPKSG